MKTLRLTCASCELRLRQFPLYSKTEPPPVLAEHFKPDTFVKSQAYGKDKAKFSLVSGLYKQVVDSAFLQYGLMAWSWKIGGNITALLGYGPEYEVCGLDSHYEPTLLHNSFIRDDRAHRLFFQILQSIAFAFTLFFVSSLPSLPLSYYQTFVLEEKHGFNKSTRSLFVTDLIKSWAIGLAIGAPFLAGFLSVFKWAGNRFVPWLMAFLYDFPISGKANSDL